MRKFHRTACLGDSIYVKRDIKVKNIIMQMLFLHVYILRLDGPAIQTLHEEHVFVFDVKGLRWLSEPIYTPETDLQGEQHRMVLMVNFFEFLKSIYFALLLLYWT